MFDNLNTNILATTIKSGLVPSLDMIASAGVIQESKNARPGSARLPNQRSAGVSNPAQNHTGTTQKKVAKFK